LPPICGDNDEACLRWVEVAQETAASLELSLPEGVSIRRALQNPRQRTWVRHLLAAPADGSVKCSTIHAAKGGEFDAVCVVIPPNDGRGNTETLCNAWRDRTDGESRRVLYVGVTRAKRLAVVAVPITHRPRCEAALRGAAVPFIVVE
jgi:DNA helicase-2/ATP-dependent DNA helicase PcrA